MKDDKIMQAIVQALRHANGLNKLRTPGKSKMFDRREGESLDEYDKRMERYNRVLRGPSHI